MRKVGQAYKQGAKGARAGGGGKPPASGERKALRKRVITTNVNALEVQGLEDFSPENVSSLENKLGQVLGISDSVADSLRAAEAFKPTQGWRMFRRPATLVRRETVEIARLLDKAQGGATERKVITGSRASGKSVLLLQAMAMAQLKNWIVIHVPEGKLSIDFSKSK